MQKQGFFSKGVGVLAAVLMLLCPCTALGAAYQDGVYRDLAPGYNDDVIVTVTVRGGQIASLEAKNRNGNESEYFQKALQGMSAAIVEKQGIDGVDTVSGATGTSQSILTAMEGVLEQAGSGLDSNSGGAGNGAENGAGGSLAGEGTNDSSGNGIANAEPSRPAMTPRPTIDPAQAEVFAGLGSTSNFRVGPGKDEQGVQVYSFNVVMASVLFDKEDRILDARVDVYEVSTPNYDGVTMPHFSGWPGKEGYNVTDPELGKVTGVSENTEESLTEEIAAWRTKRERGDQYGMNPQNEWYRQMDAYEQWMIGKTPQELRSWFARYTSQRNGRPIKPDSQDGDDRKVLTSLSRQEKDDLTDLVSMATMSLSDSHGLILEAIEKAYEQRTPVDGVGTKAAVWE